MARLARTLGALALAGGIVGSIAALAAPAALVALPACGIPNKTCLGDRVNGYPEVDAGARQACTNCLQNECCDAVGRCQDDANCRDPFLAAHGCVVDAGPAEESICTTKLAGTSRELYKCARKECAPACAIPSCDLDPAIGLIGNAACDRCIGGSCCTDLNACYASRGCKLTLDCIVNECPFAEELTLFTSFGLDEVRRARAAVCGGSFVGAGDTCVDRCLRTYAPTGEGTTVDDTTARCLAFSVFVCSAEHDCGRRCTVADAGAPLADGGVDGGVE